MNTLYWYSTGYLHTIYHVFVVVFAAAVENVTSALNKKKWKECRDKMEGIEKGLKIFLIVNNWEVNNRLGLFFCLLYCDESLYRNEHYLVLTKCDRLMFFSFDLTDCSLTR